MAGKHFQFTSVLIVSVPLCIATLLLYVNQGHTKIDSDFKASPLQRTTRTPRESRKYQYSTDEQLFQDAFDSSKKLKQHAGMKPKIAFLFLVRKDIPFEALWRCFFAGQGEHYSLYVHTSPNFTFPKTSFFFGKEIPSKQVERLSRSLADAVRRMIAMALVDSKNNNAWFVNLCEATIPLRSFDDTYRYLIGSQHSFVQSFEPLRRYLTLPHFNSNKLRKGEVWMALNRPHALKIVEDRTIYATMADECRKFCNFDERYFQTLLHLLDPASLANRTVMFVDWSGEHESSPRSFDAHTTNASFLQQIATMTEDTIYGQFHDTSAHSLETNITLQCAYNGVVGAPCFLFARKFLPSSLNASMNWLSHLN